MFCGLEFPMDYLVANLLSQLQAIQQPGYATQVGNDGNSVGGNNTLTLQIHPIILVCLCIFFLYFVSNISNASNKLIIDWIFTKDFY